MTGSVKSGISVQASWSSPDFADAQSGLRNKGGRNADRRMGNDPHPQMRRASSGTRSPVGVPPRLLPGGSRPFRSAPGQSSWDAAARCICRAGVTRPRLSQSRESTSRCGRSTAAHDARSCSGADCEPRGSTVPAPRCGSHPQRALVDERDSGSNVADLETLVKNSSPYRRRSQSHETTVTMRLSGWRGTSRACPLVLTKRKWVATRLIRLRDAGNRLSWLARKARATVDAVEIGRARERRRRPCAITQATTQFRRRALSLTNQKVGLLNTKRPMATSRACVTAFSFTNARDDDPSNPHRRTGAIRR
jgi:hypothetical protein